MKLFVFLLFIVSIPLAQLPNYSPPGKLVDLGGYKLHLNCTGKDEPTVVLIAGAGDFSFDWELVQPDIARFTRVCSYDRAGAERRGGRQVTQSQVESDFKSLSIDTNSAAGVESA